MIKTIEDRPDLASVGIGQSTVHRFSTTVALGSAAAAIVAVAGLLGYAPGLRFLGSLRSDHIPMAPSTAVCFLILTVALFFRARKPWQGAGRLAMVALVLLVTVFGLLEAVEQFVGVDLSLEDALVPQLGTFRRIPVGRMSPVTGASLALAGLGTLLLLLPSKSSRHAQRCGHGASTMGAGTAFVATTVLLAYVYGTPFMYGGATVPMAATTAIAVLCLSAALVAAAGPESLPASLFVGDSTAARLSRAFVPLVAVAVLASGILHRLGHAWTDVNDALFTSMAMIAVGVVMMNAVTYVARSTGVALDEGNRKLRESEALNRAITQSASDAIVTADSDGNIVGWNPGAETIFGYAESGVIGQPVSLLMPERYQGLYADAVGGVTSGEEPHLIGRALEVQGRRKDQTEFPLELSLAAWQSSAGLFVTGIIRDVTVTTLAKEALRESEFRWEFAIEGAGDGLWDWNVPSGAVFYSRRWKAILGYVDEEIGHSLDEWSGRVHPDDMATTMTAMQQHLDGTTLLYRNECRLRCKDGSWKWILSRGVATSRDAVGKAVRVIGTHTDMTERKHAEAQLRRSEESLAITLQSIGDAVIATDEAGLITRMNAAAERLTGWSLADATGRSAHEVFRIIDALARTPTTNPVTLVLERGSLMAVSGSRTLVARDGTEYQISDSAAPIRDVAGRMVGVVLVFNDVSEEHRVRKALADSAELLERTGEIAKIGGWQLDLRTNELVWSRQTCRIHEIDPSEALTVERAINFYDPEARPDIRTAVQAAIENGTPFDLELPLTTAKGRALWVRAQGSAVTENGRAVELHGAFQDITARKRVEDALHESEDRFRTLVEWSPEPLLVHRDGMIAYVNLAAVALFGAPSAEALAGHPLFDRVHPDFHDIVRTRLQLLTDRGDKLPKIEMRMLKIDGTVMDVESEATSIDYDGALAVLVALADITERKRAAEERTALLAQLAHSQKLESIGVLAGGVAHDFNNMLAAILGYAELAMLKLGDVHAVFPYVEAIRSAAQRSASLTRQLLAFAREQAVAPKVLVLNDTIDTLVTALRRELGEHVTLVWTPDSAVWNIEADPTQIDQILTNLALNARDAMAGRDARLEVSTSNVVPDTAGVASNAALRAGSFVELRVRDNGCGMDARTLSRIFEPFFTTKAQGKGTGLGLSTVHGIMQRHGGFVDVESAPGAGTTFHLYFPRASRVDRGPENVQQPLRIGTETILLAEDEDGVRKPVAEMLRLLGYQVLSAHDGEAAAALAASHTGPIDLLLTDVIMPGMNGSQLRERLLTLHPDVKVLVMSGYAGDAYSSESMLEAGTAFIEKPFTMPDLSQAVRKLLDG